MKIGEELGNLNIRGTGSGLSLLGIRRILSDSGQHVMIPRLPKGRDSEVQFPSELISSCVATILNWH